MTKTPENKYFLSNNLPQVSDNIKPDGLWVINRIDIIDEQNKPQGPPIQTLALGDLIEYVDRELSFTNEGVFLGTIVCKVTEIKDKEVLLIKPNKERYLMGNNSQFVNYTPFSYNNQQNIPKTTTKISGYIILISILISIICFLGWIIANHV